MDRAKESASCEAVKLVRNNMTIGIGSGSTVVYFVEQLRQRVQQENLKVDCVPSSYQAKDLIIKNGLSLRDIMEYSSLDLVVDGADEIDQNRILIKGGGACQTLEKLLASMAKQYVIIADESKCSVNLFDNWSRGIPFEVLPNALGYVVSEVSKHAKCKVRVSDKKAGPTISDSGNIILDVFSNDVAVIRCLERLCGVISSGLFEFDCRIFIGRSDGTSFEINN